MGRFIGPLEASWELLGAIFGCLRNDFSFLGCRARMRSGACRFSSPFDGPLGTFGGPLGGHFPALSGVLVRFGAPR